MGVPLLLLWVLRKIKVVLGTKADLYAVVPEKHVKMLRWRIF